MSERAPDTDEDVAQIRARVEQVFADNPGATVADVLGRLTLAPTHRELVEEVRAERDGDVEEETYSASDRSLDRGDPEHELADSCSDSSVRGVSGDENLRCDTGEPSAHEHPEHEQVRAAFSTLIEWFHARLNNVISDHTEQGNHPDRPATARTYFREVRKWSNDTITDNRLGWAPPDDGTAFAYLLEAGFAPETARATGLFNRNDDLLWQGRYILPYFDADGKPVYAIARCTGDEGGGAAGYDGHPADYLAGKYAKVAHSRDEVPITEPIWGMHTLRDGASVVVAEGIADAITAAAAGYSVLSPVAKEFKRDHFAPLLAAIENHDIERVYVLPDSERASFGRIEDAPNSPERIRDAITIPKAAPGPEGGRRTVQFLTDEEVDAQFVALPRAGLRKVDLDDYLHEWSDDLGAVMRSARRMCLTDGTVPTTTTSTGDTGSDRKDDGRERVGDKASDLWTLEITDLTYTHLSDSGDRGKNPLGHTGDSENYFVIREGKDGDLVARDYKRPGEPVFTALTYLLVDAGERSISNPEGSLSDREIWVAWKQARERGDLTDGDPIPRAALCYFAVSCDLCDADEIENGWKLPCDAYDAALETVEDEYGLDTGREHLNTGGRGDSRQHGPEKCPPPAYAPEPFDREQRWSELQGDRYEANLAATGPHIWGDPAGVGKSTNAERAAATRDRPYFTGFDKHAKTRETITDEVTPDGQFHLRGGEQPVHDCCMDAQVVADEGETPHCSTHGHPSEWPRMCPIYNRSTDDDLRQRYEALVGPLGALGAHLKLDLFDEDKHPWHGGQGRWAEQFNHLLDDAGRPLAERVAGVHEYQLLKSATEGRDVIIDESPRTLAGEQHTTVDDLVHMQVRLEGLANIHESGDNERLTENLRALAEFTDDLARTLARDEPGDFETLAAPEIQPVTFDRPVDPENLPPEVDPENVERTTWREYQGVNNDHYTEHEQITVPVEVYDEPLAKAKLAYNEGLVRQYQDEDKDLPTAPFCFDALLAAAAKAGIESDDVRRAIAVPPVLNSCPWCGSALDAENGARVCASDDCDWDERENSITQQDGERARASAWLNDDSDDLKGERPTLVYDELPDTDDLPDDPLILDATATPEKVAGLYGASMNDVEVCGDDPLDLDSRLNVTQVLDGQYHAQTIRDTESVQRRIQNVINTATRLHDKPLFGVRRDLIPLFEFPGEEGEDYEVLVYGGARGLNRTECDAVVCIGAPHPDMNDICRQAELLAMDHDNLRAGGEEYSTRRNAPNPPVYRKLIYEDEHSDGLAVPTKAYSGIAGALFREAREKEIKQFVHRTRPLLNDPATDEPVEAYLLTNVPTDLPVDQVCRFKELASDLSAVFPVPDGALDLAGAVRDVLAGNGPDGFRENTLVERRADGSVANDKRGLHRLACLAGVTARGKDKSPCYETVSEWVNRLEAVGLLDPGEYEQRRGVVYEAHVATLDSALRILSCNGFSKVAAVRRFVEKIRASDGGLGWLAWAEDVFDLSGDRCRWDPPPNPNK